MRQLCWGDIDLDQMDPWYREAVNKQPGDACDEPTNHPTGLCSYHQALILPKEALAA